jgi:hypothetical protein
MLGTAWKRPFLTVQLLLTSALPATAEVRQPRDFFVMQAVHNANVSNDVLASPKLQGIHLRDEWKLIEPTPGSYDFDWLDGQIDRAKGLGKQITLGVYTGNNSPTWLDASRVDNVPIPWDPDVTVAHNQMVAELGERYRGETAIAAVHISGPATDHSLEMHYPNGLTNVPGYSDARIVDTWKAAIDAYAGAFPFSALVLDVAMVSDEVGAVTLPVIEYARQVLGARANFIHNSLKASTDVNAAHHATIVSLGDDGARIGFEMVGPSTDEDRFGGPFSDALELGEEAGAAWYQIYAPDVQLIPDDYPGLAGDYNGNGVVDAADYTVWRDTLGQAGTGLAADSTGPAGVPDGRVDQLDYGFWKGNFGNMLGTGSGRVSGTTAPEPSTMPLAVAGALALTAMLRRRRRGCCTIRPRRTSPARLADCPMNCRGILWDSVVVCCPIRSSTSASRAAHLAL